MKTFKTITSKPEAKLGLILFFFTLLLAFSFVAEFKNTFEYISMFLIFTLTFLTISIFLIGLAIEETIKETNK